MATHRDISDLTNAFGSLKLKNKKQHKPTPAVALNGPKLKNKKYKPLPVQKNPQVLSDLIHKAKSPHCTWKPRVYKNKTYRLVTLNDISYEFTRIEDIFNKTMTKGYEVDDIRRVENPYLYAQYQLKKMQKLNKYPLLKEVELFHGTEEENIPSICKNNFNWRLSGTSVGHRYGQGVSFSQSSTYASYYPPEENDDDYDNDGEFFTRIMFVADVLIGSTCNGDKNMKVPRKPCDTSQKPDGQVIVKYEDNEFYPKYIIYYSNQAFVASNIPLNKLENPKGCIQLKQFETKCYFNLVKMSYLTESLKIEILMMIGYGDRARTQCEVVRLFRETHPDLPPLNQGTISKIEAQYREMSHVRKVPSKRQAVVDDDTKLNLLLALEENPITPACQLARDSNLNHKTVLKILKYEKKRPYKMQAVQEILEDDPNPRVPTRWGVFREALPDTHLPPEPVITRWGTWLEAVIYKLYE
ncbi:hypothetical protein NQ318_003995 [Aromia moschata]|uniref:Poly [ADP-ribose] polymerase n=1 Tax=Aromia moschata TaxID=1265417 RepID=A0AAV8Z9N6_9CUCU|nr:hypothetical protein NQ318_003995 [Aromia moschata]